MKQVTLGTGLAFWGDALRPAKEMVEQAEIDYLCCDHLAELTMSILTKQRLKDEERGYTSDVVSLLRSVLPTCREKGIKVISNAGGANPSSCARRIVKLCRELGLDGTKVAVVTGDDILPRIDELLAAGVDLSNMDTGEPLDTVRDRLTQANVYIGCEGIVEALARGADIVICGRVTDVALYLAPMRHELGWTADDVEMLGAGTGIAHLAECGGQATGGLYSNGWQEMERLVSIGYPVTTVYENGEALISKTPGSGGAVTVGTVSEQLVYEILDPANYLTADVTADLSQIRLDQDGTNRVRIRGITGKPAPPTLKVNMGYRAGFVGEALFTYTWPQAYAKAQAGIKFLETRLERAGFEADEVRIEYLGHNSMFGRGLIPEPDDPDLMEIVVRWAARCRNEEDARKVFTESVPLYNNGPAGLSGIGTRPPIKELFALWPCLIPRELVPITVDMVEA
jgi:Acyclic terpene utilisation family protein AtuA